MKIACRPPPMSSDQTTHGTVGLAGLSVPAATLGSSAFAVATLFIVQAFSAETLAAHGPKFLPPLRSRISVSPAVPAPTACQWKPPSAAASATPLAAKIRSLFARPIPLLSSSYQTVHGTVSLGPVKAMSGATLLRVGSMLSVGSPVLDDFSAPFASRLMPVCCQQNPFTGVPPAGVTPAQVVAPAIPRETKISNLPAASVAAPSFSFQTTHGTGLLPAIVAPPATDGSSAVRSVWMFSDGICELAVRSWPDGSQRFEVELNRLAKMFVVVPPARLSFGSYHDTHGVALLGPAKSIAGSSATFVGSMFSDAGKPCVTHFPPLNDRTKICWLAPAFCSNVAHGTRAEPATRLPPTTSEMPASCAGSIPFAGSLLT